ncbi:TPA: hypothetical protein HA259_04435 [Thermoplasmata archaeon]|nr:hypothetical protein [Thermoplasmata archaeon]
MESVQQAIAELQEGGTAEDPRVDELLQEVENLRAEIDGVRQAVSERPSTKDEQPRPAQSSEEIAAVTKTVESLSMRIKRIEDYLRALSSARKKQ